MGAMWASIVVLTRPWRDVLLYRATGPGAWRLCCSLRAVRLFAVRAKFSAKQLGGLPEVHGGNRDQRLVTDGIRSRVRHPVYLAHVCEMLAWSVGTGLAVCWGRQYSH